MNTGFTITLLYRNHKAPQSFDRPLVQVSDREIADTVRALAARIDRAIESSANPLPWPDWGHIKGDKR
jgi:hypothetical protein